MAKQLGYLTLTVLVFFTQARLVIAQTVDSQVVNKRKLVIYERKTVELSAGISFSKFQIRPATLRTSTLLSPFADVTLNLPILPKFRIKTGLSYQVIGSSLTTYDNSAVKGTANRRLDYISVHMGAGYNLSQLASRFKTEVTGGFFIGKQLDDVTVNRFPNQQTIRNPSTDATIGYNYGVMIGIGTSILLHQRHRLGLKVLYNQGLIDIRTQGAKIASGEIPGVTQSFAFCSFITI